MLQGLRLRKNDKRKFVILSNITGTLVPSRFTLLLGPPGSGKSTLLKALSNQLRRTGVEVRAGAHFMDSSGMVFWMLSFREYPGLETGLKL